MDTTTHSVLVDGLEVAFQRAGAGPPLVLVHGGVEDSRAWTPQIAALSDEFSVVAWDEPGAGRSSDLPARGFTLADYANCLHEVIRSAGPGPAHIAGLSWGSTVALELYRLHPEIVGTLILAGGYAGWRGSLPPDEVESRLADVHRLLDAPPDGIGLALPGLFAGEPPAELVPLLDAMNADARPESVRTELTLMAATDLSAVLPKIDVPTLLIWGELDVRSPLAVAREFERSIPHATLTVIPRCGHVVNLERPAEFNRAVREFCRAHPLATWRRPTAART